MNFYKPMPGKPFRPGYDEAIKLRVVAMYVSGLEFADIKRELSLGLLHYQTFYEWLKRYAPDSIRKRGGKGRGAGCQLGKRKGPRHVTRAAKAVEVPPPNTGSASGFIRPCPERLVRCR